MVVTVVAGFVLMVLLLSWIFTGLSERTVELSDDPSLVLDQSSQQQSQEVLEIDAQISDQEVAVIRARTATSLDAVGSKLSADTDYEVALRAVELIELELQAAYARAREETKADWVQVQRAFDDVENRLRASSTNSVLMLTALSTSLRKGMVPNEQVPQ